MALATTLGGLTTPLALAADAYPSRPIRMIVPFPPGGGTDVLARIVAQKLTETYKWSIVPDNRGGAGGTLGITEAVRAKPDGYEMVMGQKDNLAVGPWLYKGLSWNPTRDLVAVSHVAYAPVLIATSAKSKYKTLADVVAAAKAAPDTVTYGSPGSGTTIHLAGDLFQRAAKIQIRHVPYKGSNPALMDALSGNVDLVVSSIPSAIGQIKAGALRPLAVTSAKRSSSLPDVPTVAESGYAGFDVSTWYGLFMPAKANPQAVKAMHEAVNAVLALPDTQKAIQEQGAEPLTMSQPAFSQTMAKDYKAWEKIVQDAGLKLE
nr:tripartite tricarboxylate transporter substrate binding protein [Comamonas serinivorans]